MKKAMGMFLAAVLAMGLTACGSGGTGTTAAAPAETGGNAGTAAEDGGASEEGGGEAAAGDQIVTPYGNLPADGPEINLVLASDATENSLHSLAAVHMTEVLAEETQGKITVTYYPNAQLGSDTEILTSCVAGDIDMDLMSGALAQSLVPESCLFNIPFLNSADDLEAIIKTMVDSDFRTAFDACYEEAGLKLLVLSLGQSFELNTVKPVTSVDDIAGLKIRTVPGESYMAIWNAWGANPTPMAYSELYTALQQGVVDGHDQMLSNILAVKFYEQAKYVMMTNHNYGSFTIVMNLDNYEALSPEYQEVLSNVGDYMSDYLTRSFQDGAASDRAALEELGVEFYDLSPEEVEALKEKGAAGIAAVEDMVQNDELIALYKSCLEENR